MTIELYVWSTPNGRKVSIMLEECNLSYDLHKIDINKGEQFNTDFLEINPNGKIPAIIDPDGPDGKSISMFESGAILYYLAEKTGKFMPVTPRDKYTVMQWLMWQMAGFGPMLGQAHHFRKYAPTKIDYAYDRYSNEAKRLYTVLDKRLGEVPYLAGKSYTIADIATYPWAARFAWQGIDWDDYPHAKRWFDELSDRPAVIVGMDI